MLKHQGFFLTRVLTRLQAKSVSIGESQQRLEALNSEAVSMARRGQIAAAENLWLEVLSLEPGLLPVRTNLARLYFQTGRYLDVLNLCDPITPSVDVSAAFSALVGQASLRCSRFTNAVQWLRHADRLRPHDAGLQLSLSEALLGTGQLDEAVGLLEDLVAKYPNALEPLLNLAVVYTEAGYLTQAASTYQKLQRQWPEDPLVLTNAGRFHLDHGVYDQALRTVQRLVSGQSQSRQARRLLADVYRAGGDSVRAREIWQQLVKEDPEDLDARLPLIYAAMEQSDWSVVAEQANAALSIANNAPPSRLLAALIDLPIQVKALLPKYSISFDASDLVAQHQVFDVHDPLLDAVQTWLLSQSSLVEDRPGKPTRGGLQSHELLDRCGDSFSQLLLGHIKPFVTSYRQQLQQQLPLSWLPFSQVERYSGWGVVLRSGGRQIRHTHPEAVLSGVLYLQVPASIEQSQSNEGSLWFSPNPLVADGQSGLKVRPVPGLLVLFPSFLAHETIPFDSGEDRVCIAFNVS